MFSGLHLIVLQNSFVSPNTDFPGRGCGNADDARTCRWLNHADRVVHQVRHWLGMAHAPKWIEFWAAQTRNFSSSAQATLTVSTPAMF